MAFFSVTRRSKVNVNILLYGLLNDALELFYIGCTANPELRRKNHVADFQGVRDLKMFMLGWFGDLAEARRSEEALVRQISMSSDMLINVNYNEGRSDPLRTLIRKHRRSQHFGPWQRAPYCLDPAPSPS